MRMWMIDPKLMCIQHIVGEHRELHALSESILRTNPECDNSKRHRKNLITLAENGLIELKSLKNRHGELVKFIENHNSPLEEVPSLKYLPQGVKRAEVDEEKAIQDLIDRPAACRPKGYCREKLRDFL